MFGFLNPEVWLTIFCMLTKCPDHLFHDPVPTLEVKLICVPLIFLGLGSSRTKMFGCIFIIGAGCAMLSLAQLLEHWENDIGKSAIHAPCVPWINANRLFLISVFRIFTDCNLHKKITLNIPAKRITPMTPLRTISARSFHLNPT